MPISNVISLGSHIWTSPRWDLLPQLFGHTPNNAGYLPAGTWECQVCSNRYKYAWKLTWKDIPYPLQRSGISSIVGKPKESVRPLKQNIPKLAKICRQWCMQAQPQLLRCVKPPSGLINIPRDQQMHFASAKTDIHTPITLLSVFRGNPFFATGILFPANS